MKGYCPVLRNPYSHFPTPYRYTDIAFEPFTEFDNVRKFVVIDSIKGSFLYNQMIGIKSDFDIEKRDAK